MLIRVNELTLPLHFNYIIEMLYDAWENNFRQEPIHQLRDTEEGGRLLLTPLEKALWIAHRSSAKFRMNTDTEGNQSLFKDIAFRS